MDQHAISPERIKAHPGNCPAGRHGIRHCVRDIKKGIEVLRVERDRIDPIGNALWYDRVAEGIDAHAGLILYPYPLSVFGFHQRKG